ncbi:type IV secretion system protein, partial [Wolbachia endosymbiont of Pentidionis agamae]|uniref:type IV secretion system protein n=1 Tax=Wolbachia endosymbiont of Pentidionis agamae TaxID=3110435 RepID=UPI002FD4FA4F
IDNNTFAFLDVPLNRFLHARSWLLMISLIFSGPLGIVAFAFVIWGFITITLSIFNALFVLLTSIAIIALLLALAPLFIICILFQHTKGLFTSWITALARVAIHPVILLFCFALISRAMDYIIYSMFNFEVCPHCILEPSFDLKIFKFSFCLFSYYASKFPPNIGVIIAFVILVHSMKALIKSSNDIADALFHMMMPTQSAGGKYKQNLLGFFGMNQESRGRRGGGSSPSSSSSSSMQRRPPIPPPRGRT